MEIMFDDLTPEAQEKLLDEAGVSSPEDMYWDEVPVAVVEFTNDDDDIDDHELSDLRVDDHEFDDIYDCDYD